MTKEQFNYFSSKPSSFLLKARSFYVLFILISFALFIGMFIYQVVSFFMTFIMILTIIALLYHFVFKEYIFFSRKYLIYKRILEHKTFTVSEDVVSFFDNQTFQKLYDQDYELVVKNDVYVMGSKPIDNSIYTLALGVYFNDLETEAVSATPKSLSNDLSNLIMKPSIVKVILLISDEFKDDEKDYLKYSAFFHKNTVVLGLEKNTKTLYYNYFLNGAEIDEYFSEFFKVDLSLEDFVNEEED